MSRLVSGLLVLLAGTLVLSGCSSDSPHKKGDAMATQEALLLGIPEVPGATSATLIEQLPQTPFCSPIAQAEVSARVYAQDRVAVRQFTVGPATVVNAVFDVLTADYRPEVFDRGFSLGVRVCPQAPMRETSNDGTSSQGDMTPLTGLPDGAVGYTIVVTGSTGPRTVTRAFAMAGSKIVVVGASQPGTEAPAVDLGPLLTAALAKAGQPSAGQSATGQPQPA
jgi:hypothetical protein